MRASLPTPRRTDDTSAPTRSHSSATSFMNEIRVASMALATYFASSAERGVMNIKRSLLSCNGL